MAIKAKDIEEIIKDASEAFMLIAEHKAKFEQGVVDNNVVIKANNIYNRVRSQAFRISDERRSLENSISKINSGDVLSAVVSGLSTYNIVSGILNDKPLQTLSGVGTSLLNSNYDAHASETERLAYVKNAEESINSLERRLSNAVFELKEIQQKFQKPAEFVYDNGKIYLKDEPTKTDVLEYVKNRHQISVDEMQELNEKSENEIKFYCEMKELEESILGIFKEKKFIRQNDYPYSRLLRDMDYDEEFFNGKMFKELCGYIIPTKEFYPYIDNALDVIDKRIEDCQTQSESIKTRKKPFLQTQKRFEYLKRSDLFDLSKEINLWNSRKSMLSNMKENTSVDFINKCEKFEKGQERFSDLEFRSDAKKYYNTKEGLNNLTYLPSNYYYHLSTTKTQILPESITEYLNKNNLCIDLKKLKSIKELTTEDKYFVKTVIKNADGAFENSYPIKLITNAPEKTNENNKQ